MLKSVINLRSSKLDIVRPKSRLTSRGKCLPGREAREVVDEQLLKMMILKIAARDPKTVASLLARAH